MAADHTKAKDVAAQVVTSETDIKVGGERVHLWVKRAKNAAGKQPAIILAHGFSGVIHEPLLRYGDHFAAAGLTVVLFDYRTFGRSGGLPRQWMDIPRQQEEWRAVIAWAQSRDDVDAARVAIWGSSFSGGSGCPFISERACRCRIVSRQRPERTGKFIGTAARNMVDDCANIGHGRARRVRTLHGFTRHTC